MIRRLLVALALLLILLVAWPAQPEIVAISRNDAQVIERGTVVLANSSGPIQMTLRMTEGDTITLHLLRPTNSSGNLDPWLAVEGLGLPLLDSVELPGAYNGPGLVVPPSRVDQPVDEDGLTWLSRQSVLLRAPATGNYHVVLFSPVPGDDGRVRLDVGAPVTLSGASRLWNVVNWWTLRHFVDARSIWIRTLIVLALIAIGLFFWWVFA